MRWFRVLKGPSPDTGAYRDWKERLAEEARHQCVYCAIEEGRFGGYRNFHVEHFRPKSRFPALEHSYPNLFYACAVCNAFKSNDWIECVLSPDVACYPDPSARDYGELLAVGTAGQIEGKGLAGKYIVERLFLNRPQLLLERRLVEFEERARAEASRIRALAQELLRPGVDEECRNDGIRLLAETAGLIGLQTRFASGVPYRPADLARQA